MTMIGPARWTEKYLEIPFVDPGHSLKGCHCWGLVWLVYMNELGIELDKFGEFSASQIRQAAREINKGRFLPPWVPVIGPRRQFDGIVMSCENDNPDIPLSERRFVIPGHVGIASSENYILHIEEGIHSVNMHEDHPRLKDRILGVYRHEEMVRRHG